MSMCLALSFFSMNAVSQEVEMAPSSEGSVVAEPSPAPEPEASVEPVEAEVSLDQLVSAGSDLVKDYKGMGKLGLAIALLNFIMMMLKNPLLGAWLTKRSSNMKKFSLLVLGQAMGILIAVEGGLAPLSAVIAGLVTSGGAMAIYEAYKKFIKKSV